MNGEGRCRVFLRCSPHPRADKKIFQECGTFFADFRLIQNLLGDSRFGSGCIGFPVPENSRRQQRVGPLQPLSATEFLEKPCCHGVLAKACPETGTTRLRICGRAGMAFR